MAFRLTVASLFVAFGTLIFSTVVMAAADLIVINSDIYTVDPQNPRVEAFAPQSCRRGDVLLGPRSLHQATLSHPSRGEAESNRHSSPRWHMTCRHMFRRFRIHRDDRNSRQAV